MGVGPQGRAGMGAGQVHPVGGVTAVGDKVDECTAGETKRAIDGSVEERIDTTWCSVVGMGMGEGPLARAGMGAGHVNQEGREWVPEKAPRRLQQQRGWQHPRPKKPQSRGKG